MIYGIGIDIVEIDRIKRVIMRSGDKLARRILREPELKTYYNKKYPVYFLSKSFAAKEATAKAFGTGLAHKIAFSHLEIYHDNLGKPMLRLFSEAAALAEKLNVIRSYLTVSDTRLYACAMVIFESF